MLVEQVQQKRGFESNSLVCEPVPELDIEPWLEENIDSLSVERDIACRLGDTGLDVLVGDTDAETLGGEPGGVMRGVLVWDAKRRLCDTRDLAAAIFGMETEKICKSDHDTYS